MMIEMKKFPMSILPTLIFTFSILNGIDKNPEINNKELLELLQDIQIRESKLRIYLNDGSDFEASHIISLDEKTITVNLINTRWTTFKYSKNWESDEGAQLPVYVSLSDINTVEEISRTNYFKELLYMGGTFIIIFAVLMNV